MNDAVEAIDHIKNVTSNLSENGSGSVSNEDAEQLADAVLGENEEQGLINPMWVIMEYQKHFGDIPMMDACMPLIGLK